MHRSVKISFRLLVVALLTTTSAGCPSEKPTPEKTNRSHTDNTLGPSETQTLQAQEWLNQGRAEEALELATAALIRSPENVSTLQVVAQSQSALGHFADAAATARTIAALTTDDPIAQWIQAFSWHLKSGQLADAESDLRQAVSVDPADIRARRWLAQFLTAQGRRQEAYQQLIVIGRAQQLSRLELTAMIDLTGPYDLVDYGPLKDTGKPNLFDLGKARFERGDNDTAQALNTIRSLAKELPEDPNVIAFEGRLLIETNNHEEFLRWRERLPKGIQSKCDYWVAIAGWLASQNQNRQAVRAFAEALRRNPTDRTALRLLSEELLRMGKDDEAKTSRESLGILNEIFRFAGEADAQRAMLISQQLQSLARPWEALGWYRHALALNGNANPPRDQIDAWAQANRNWEKQGNEDQIQLARLRQLIGFDHTQYPLPDVDPMPGANPMPNASGIANVGAAAQNVGAAAQNVGSADHNVRSQTSQLRFTDVAARVGLQVPVISDYSLTEPKFYLYQANGCGIGVIDFDLDGRCDIYLAQSGGDPQKAETSTPNQLFRQIDNDTFQEVSKFAGPTDRGFGQGVCAGDVNQDGFADLLVANIGANAVYINQGDGTFRRDRTMGIGSQTQWTSSIAVSDLDGDALPEIVEINYLDDPKIFQLQCEGKLIACAPQDFRPAVDRFYKNDGDGTVSPWDPDQTFAKTPNYGFALVIANFDEQHGNDLFISNDGDLNHYWQSASTADQSRFRLIESAGAAGCSVGVKGFAEACMGIAASDFDRNGLLDLLTTNFYDQPVNLFLQITAGFFIDEASQYDLNQSSIAMLGFGTQAADFDNDGWNDAAILNGHLYDARYAGIGFRMPAQLLQGGPHRFDVQEAAKVGPYWTREQLGRTLAKWDFNRDGKMDLIANHLDQPVAVLRNDCESQNWIQLELIGVESERDAIGAKAVVTAGDQSWTSWQIGGDGYMCSNESVIAIGLAQHDKVQRIDITWPSGQIDTINHVDTNSRYVIIEGRDHLKRERLAPK